MKAATKAVDSARKEVKFQSTPPVKAATGPDAVVVTGETKFQSTPPVKAATGNRIPQ